MDEKTDDAQSKGGLLSPQERLEYLVRLGMEAYDRIPGVFDRAGWGAKRNAFGRALRERMAQGSRGRAMIEEARMVSECRAAREAYDAAESAYRSAIRSKAPAADLLQTFRVTSVHYMDLRRALLAYCGAEVEAGR